MRVPSKLWVTKMPRTFDRVNDAVKAQIFQIFEEEKTRAAARRDAYNDENDTDGAFFEVKFIEGLELAKEKLKGR